MMNTKNRREKIQRGILAKGFIDDFGVYTPTENTENEKKVNFDSTIYGCIYGFSLLYIVLTDLTHEICSTKYMPIKPYEISTIFISTGSFIIDKHHAPYPNNLPLGD